MPYRVIFQVSDPDANTHETALRNIRNTAADLGDDASVAVVAHGPGIGLLTGATGFEDQVGEIVKSGIEVLACRNTLNRLSIPVEDLLPGVEVVSAGIGEIVRRQHEGWAYVRP